MYSTGSIYGAWEQGTVSGTVGEVVELTSDDGIVRMSVTVSRAVQKFTLKTCMSQSLTDPEYRTWGDPVSRSCTLYLCDNNNVLLGNLSCSPGSTLDFSQYPNVYTIWIKVGGYVTGYKATAADCTANGHKIVCDFLAEYDFAYWELDDNGELDTGLFPEMPETTMTEPYPKSLWRIDGDSPEHELLPEVQIETMTKPYPASMWRIEHFTEDGTPYHELLPGVAGVNLHIQPSASMIHVYDSRETNFDGNGYAVIEPISCEIRHEKNGLYEAELKCDIDDVKFKYLVGNALLKVPIRYHGKIKWQVFRIYMINPTMDSSGAYRININARHIFYDLNDRMIRNCIVSGNGNDALNGIFDAVYIFDAGDGFMFGHYSDIRTVSQSDFTDGTTVTAALLGDDNSIINRWGGVLYRDNLYFSINSEMEYSKNTGVIRYGSNMIDVDFSMNYSDCITVLIATDNFGHRTKIMNENVPCAEFPHHICRTVKFNYSYDNESQFLSDAQAYFDNYKQPSVNIKVTFADLSDTELYADFLDLADFEVGDKVIVYHKDLDINYGNLEIIGKTYDVVNAQTVDIEIGTFKNAVSRSVFMSGTVSTGTSATDKQLAAMQNDLKNVKLKTLRTWDSASASTWDEMSVFTWEEAENIGN